MINRQHYITLISGMLYLTLTLKVTLLSRIHHKHLVKFLGYSQQDDSNILVYEFMHEGTLAEHLRGTSRISHRYFTFHQ